MTTLTATVPATVPALTSVTAGLVRPPDEVRMPAHRRPGHTIVALSGALDGAAAPALREHLIGVLRYSGRLLILDLREVATADTAGLAVLVGIQRRAAGLGVTVRLAAPGPQVAAQLRLTAFDRVLTVHSTPDIHAEIAV
ncbi:anti-sigma factor antagonist [Actinomadura sp. KC216]|uniref:STAS domain-containing protein n=1 Tax=Actinomadura sp. KC216 TaxID=2530370 RepID=UPI0010436138|nr:STAS domain-containing protein [Actinomadura sp. KC216]TDB88233.1 anti-sigma factor antagonist [Actinomadura sp. KC216]